VVEDDPAVGTALSQALESQGYAVALAGDGAAAIGLAEEHEPSLVLLDLGLPDMDGIEVCRRLRSLDATLPIIALTARNEEIDIVVGLDAGADDYVTKPFRLAELLARVRARLRTSESRDQFTVGTLTVDAAARRAWLGDVEVELRPREFDLLALLASKAGSAVTRERIMNDVWDRNWYGSTKTLDVHVSALRRKFAVATDAPRIVALRNVGYRLEA
jgi:DNA-binding response OmpR family regulator